MDQDKKNIEYIPEAEDSEAETGRANSPVGIRPQGPREHGVRAHRLSEHQPGHHLHQTQDLAVGEIVADRYKILSLIGRGAMGTVYRVEQLALRKNLALKTLNTIATSDINVRRFQNEALAAGKLEHPNLVRSLDSGWISTQPFLVMDLVEGQTLSQHLKRVARLPLEDALRMFIPICFGLAYAHQQCVVHRDLKPSNIMLVQEGTGRGQVVPKIVDFGIAKLDYGEGATLTQTGEVFGTPLYMSPEQCLGAKVDNRSDIYSLGCVLYEALTGAPPFRGPSALETMMQHRNERPLSLKEASLGTEFPKSVEQIVFKMLAKEPQDRYQSFLEVAQDLASVERGEKVRVNITAPSAAPGSSKPIRYGLMIASTVLICVTLALFVYTVAKSEKPEISQKSEAATSSPITTAAAGATDPAALTATPALTGPAALTASAAASSTFAAQSSPATATIDPANAKAISDEHDNPLQPFSSIVGPNRVFDFGSLRLGNFKISPQEVPATKQMADPKQVAATKQVMVDRNANITLCTLFTKICKYPQLLGRFREDDLHGLILDPPNELSEELVGFPQHAIDNALSCAWHLKSLEYLSLAGAPITIRCLNNLHVEDLKHLQRLEISNTHIDGKDLARLEPFLRQLQALNMANLANARAVIRALHGSTNITHISLAGCSLTNSDIALLAMLPKLQTLDLSRCNITDSGLVRLATVKSLTRITLADCPITVAGLKTLTGLPRLKELVLPVSLEKDLRAVGAILPGYTIKFEGSHDNSQRRWAERQLLN